MMTCTKPSNNLIHSVTLESGCSAAANGNGQLVTQLPTHTHIVIALIAIISENLSTFPENGSYRGLGGPSNSAWFR